MSCLSKCEHSEVFMMVNSLKIFIGCGYFTIVWDFVDF